MCDAECVYRGDRYPLCTVLGCCNTNTCFSQICDTFFLEKPSLWGKPNTSFFGLFLVSQQKLKSFRKEGGGGGGEGGFFKFFFFFFFFYFFFFQFALDFPLNLYLPSLYNTYTNKPCTLVSIHTSTWFSPQQTTHMLLYSIPISITQPLFPKQLHLIS